jgi:serine phosphatase RsbU (regulator of sigma subunit)
MDEFVTVDRVEGTGRRRLTNFWLLAGLILTTGVVFGVELFADPEARLGSLLVFLPAIVASLGTVRQTLFAGGWSTAAVFVSLFDHPEPHIRDSVLVLSGTALFAAFATVACQRRLARENEIDSLRFTATALQRQILRPLPQRDRLVQVEGVYEPVQEDRLVGGDIYDVASTAFGTRVLIGDVQGKGVPALGAGIAVIGAFREAAHREPELSGVVAAMEEATRRYNADAEHSQEPERFVTACVLCFGTEDEVRVIDCGHLPAYLIDRNGPVRVHFTEVSVPLGLDDLVDSPRRESRFAFPPGSALVLYTDGLTEARDRDGGFYPLEQRLAVFAGLPPGRLARALSHDVAEHARRRQDDLAILVVKRREEADEPNG